MSPLFILTIFVYANAIGKPESVHLSALRVPNYPFESRKTMKYSCILPPRLENWSSFVVDEPTTTSEDSFQQVTLVRYRTEERNQLVEINALACSYGEWFEILLQHESEYMYFNTSACPSLCPEPSTESPPVSSTMRPEVTKKDEQQTNLCHLPPNSLNTQYNVKHEIKAESGEAFKALYLSYQCTRRLFMVGKPDIYCFHGLWNDDPPKCLNDPETSTDFYEATFEFWQSESSCIAPRQPKHGRYVVLNNPGVKAGAFRDELHLRYACNADTKLIGRRDVYCVDRMWSGKRPVCVRCGLAGDENQPSATLPWHVGVYDKRSTPYEHICGGSIIASNLVVSAAHCFWTEGDGIAVALNFAVAVGKAYRNWDDDRDRFAQKSDASDIATPSRFRGGVTNFQDDIALLFLTSPLDYNEYVAPLCIDFDTILDEQQMKPGNVGKIVVNNEDDDGSPNFQVKDLPYVDIEKCIADTSPRSRPYITSDKMCAGVANGTSLCKRDSGSGLAYPAVDEANGVVTYRLRGVFVPCFAHDQPCGASSVAAFTDVSAHARFLKFHFALATW